MNEITHLEALTAGVSLIAPRIEDHVAAIVAAYVSGNAVQASELPNLIVSVHAALVALDGSAAPAQPAPALPTAAEIKKSIKPTALISFEDGKPYKTLRRHLTMRGISPEEYRKKWGLPVDYPMTCQAYSEQRSQLARDLGLGQMRWKGQQDGPLETKSAPQPQKTRAKRQAA